MGDKKQGKEAMVVEGNYVHLQLEEILHMNGGDGDSSYANNSFFQKKVMLKAKPILQESVVDLYKKIQPECITMADMGCSSGPNTLLPIWEVIDAIDEECHRLNKKIPNFQVFLNDLPGNDFDSIFRSLTTFYKKIEKEKGSKFGPCFIGAMPGTFYGRLFPPRSLHFVHSSYSLHWLSEVPKIPENKGNIYLARTSPSAVHKAYLNQFERDFKIFLSARSEEIIPQGRMVLTIYGRQNDDKQYSSNKYTPQSSELLGMMLNDMVFEGLIEESKLDTFNVPFYGPSAEELKNIIKEEGSFNINRFETFDMEWDAMIDDGYKDRVDKYTKGKYVANHMRAALESIMAKHFGSELVDIIFQRFSIMMADYLEQEYGAYTNHVISMTKE